jgi:ATP-binding cassette subfamily F protein uup
MDKVVDHLLVFQGEGKIKDFPGNYSQYREWIKLQPKDEANSLNKKNPNTDASNTANASGPRDPNAVKKRKMTFKEKQEFAQLDKDIDALTEERKKIEEELSSGTSDVERITELSKRLPLLNEELEEKEMRWLELSEIAS